MKRLCLLFVLVAGFAFGAPLDIRRVSSNGANSLLTVKHDGHLFIVYTGSNKGTIINHPDCKKCRVPFEQRDKNDKR